MGMSSMEVLDKDWSWAWEKLLAHDEAMVDAAWCELLRSHWECRARSAHTVQSFGCSQIL